jgi:pimeloyl-ACP methyl ester carboxylesterase
MTVLTPFQAHIPDDILVDLRQRLARTRFTEDLPGVGWDDGTPAAHLREQVDHWLQRFDWRAQEARLNAFPQLTTEVDGATVHLLLVRSPEPDATPAILSHGWPGTVFEWLDVLRPLTDPRAHGGDPRTALHLVVPSLPGFAFSGPTRERGWGVERICDASVTLMARLGFERFVAIGNDWGSSLSLVLARKHPERVLGAHVTQIFDSLANAAARLPTPTPEEQRAIEGQAWFEANMSAYQRVQEQQPMSLAHALTDSPAGLLGWLNIVFRELGPGGLLPHLPSSHVPVALAGFANDTVSIRRLAAEVHRNIVAWNSYSVGSHWAAHSAPETWLADVRSFVRSLRD